MYFEYCTKGNGRMQEGLEKKEIFSLGQNVFEEIPQKKPGAYAPGLSLSKKYL